MVRIKQRFKETLDFDIDTEYDVIDCQVLLTQNGKLILSKTLKDGNIQIVGNKIYYTITEEETMLFEAPDYINIEIYVKYTNGGKDSTEKGRIVILSSSGDVEI